MGEILCIQTAKAKRERPAEKERQKILELIQIGAFACQEFIQKTRVCFSHIWRQKGQIVNTCVS